MNRRALLQALVVTPLAWFPSLRANAAEPVLEMIRPQPVEMLTTGVAAIDNLVGGLPIGRITTITIDGSETYTAHVKAWLMARLGRRDRVIPDPVSEPSDLPSYLTRPLEVLPRPTHKEVCLAYTSTPNPLVVIDGFDRQECNIIKVSWWMGLRRDKGQKERAVLILTTPEEDCRELKFFSTIRIHSAGDKYTCRKNALDGTRGRSI